MNTRTEVLVKTTCSKITGKPDNWNVGDRLRLISDNPESREWKAGIIPQGTEGVLHCTDDKYHIIFDNHPAKGKCLFGIAPSSWTNYMWVCSAQQGKTKAPVENMPTCKTCKWHSTNRGRRNDNICYVSPTIRNRYISDPACRFHSVS